MQVEVCNILVEVCARGSLDTEAPPAQRNFIEIKLDDLLLGEDLLDALCEEHFLHFARHGVLITQQQVLRDLLRYGGSAHRSLARSEFDDVIDNCIECAGEIDPAMGEKRLVLSR